MLSEVSNVDIWSFHPADWIVITTNQGWKKSTGAAVMGAGIAKQAADRVAGLADWYGARNRHRTAHDEAVDLYHPGKLVMFPTKVLNPAFPELSWQGRSSLNLIHDALESMARVVEAFGEPGINRVYLPPPGCGSGKLQLWEVRPLLDRILKPSRVEFVLVKRAWQ